MCCYNGSPDECRFEKILQVVDIYRFRDSSDNCWFHSTDMDWKKRVDAKAIIDDYINSYLSLDLNYLDLSTVEFDDSINYVLTQVGGNYNVNFENCTFHTGMKLKDFEFNSALSFRNAKFLSDVSFSNVKFDGADLRNTEICGNLFLSKSINKSYFYLENANVHGGLIFTKVAFHHMALFDEITTNSNPTILRTTTINNCIFSNQASFTEARINRSFVFINNEINGQVSFERTAFDCDMSSPVFAAVQVSNNSIREPGKMSFKGRDLEKIFSTAKDVVFLDNDIEGELRFENADLQKVDRLYRKNLVEESIRENANVIIGPGCLKYFNQTPIREVFVNKHNQNLVQDICNTFAKYFRSESSYSLGVEIVERTPTSIKYFYFTDEPIAYEEFVEDLRLHEYNMWALIKLNDQTIQANTKPTDLGVRDKILQASDVLVDLVGIVLKAATRASLLKLDRAEMQRILNSASLDPNINSIEASHINTLNVNQVVLLGIGNSQEVGGNK